MGWWLVEEPRAKILYNIGWLLKQNDVILFITYIIKNPPFQGQLIPIGTGGAETKKPEW